MLTTDVLRKRGIDLSDEQFARLLDDALDGLAAPVAADPTASLTPAETTALTAGGADLRPQGGEEPGPRAESAAAYAALLAGGLTVAQAAVRLDVDPSRIRHRLADRTLYGVRLRGGWRLPAFQFAEGGGGTVPGLDRVLPAMPIDLHPVAVWRWLTTPVPDLAVDDTEASPLRWLAGGGAPAPVAALASGL